MTSKRRIEPHPDQGILFSTDEIEIPKSDVSATGQFIGQAGASVDLGDRAFELGRVFKELNAASSRAGLQMAVTTPYRRSLENRYGRNLDQVVDGARAKENSNIFAAKQHFARASGMYAMIGAGMSPEEAKKMTQDMFRAFTSRYGVGVTNADVRNRSAHKIKKSASTITGKAIK